MQCRPAALLMMLVLALAPAAFAGGKADQKASVTFHMETEEGENPKMVFQQEAFGKMRTFQRMGEISTQDILSFSPFPSTVIEGDYGIVFKLKETPARRLLAITNLNQGKWMLAQINGRVIDGVLIDKPVNDGRLVVWKGVTLEDVKAFDASFPRIGQEGKKKK